MKNRKMYRELKSCRISIQVLISMDFPGDPVVKTLFSNARGVGSILFRSQDLMPCLPKAQTENRKNIVMKSIKPFKREHIKNFF